MNMTVNVIDKLLESLATASQTGFSFAYDAPETRAETGRITIEIRRAKVYRHAEDSIVFECNCTASVKFPVEMAGIGALCLAIPNEWNKGDEFSEEEIKIRATSRTEDVRPYAGTLLESTLSFEFYYKASYDKTKATLNQIIWSNSNE